MANQRSAICPPMNGAMIEAIGMVMYTRPMAVGLNPRPPRWSPRTGAQTPQMAYWRNIIALRRESERLRT